MIARTRIFQAREARPRKITSEARKDEVFSRKKSRVRREVQTAKRFAPRAMLKICLYHIKDVGICIMSIMWI